MALFDRFRRGKRSESSGSSEESFDLDDDALFGSSGDSGDDDAFGSLSDLGAQTVDDGFGTEAAGAEDLGAAATADFDDFDNLGGGLDSPADMGDDFGDAGLGLDDDPGAQAEPPGKKRGRKARGGRAPGRGRVVLISLAVFLIAVGGGFVGGPILKSVITGEGRLRKQVEAETAKLTTLRQELQPLRRAASPDEVRAMQTEMTTRRAQMQTVDAVEIKVADVSDRRTARDLALARRDAAGDLLAVRKATLRNVAKQSHQIEMRIAYLRTRTARFEEESRAYDARVRVLQADLPPEYSGAATADATRTLSIHAGLPGPPPE